MRTITVFYDNSSYTLTWLRALVWAEKEFLEEGYKIVFNYTKAPLPKMDCLLSPPTTLDSFIKMFKNGYDIVLLAYHHSRPGLCKLSVEDRAEVLKYIKKHCNQLVWLDTADGTGTCMFDVLPHVDLYFKKQLLVDKTRYTKNIWSGRIFGEFYHNNFGINETGQRDDADFSVLNEKYLGKIKLSWNVGLGDLFTKRGKRWIYRNCYAPIKFVRPSDAFCYELHYRGSGYPGAIGFQRTFLTDILKTRNDIRMPNVSQKAPYREYVKEMSESLTLISPFGWGEICGRDFEAFAFGTALIKPNMNHLITYPNFYIENETYVSLDWDFSNLNDIIELMKKPEGVRKFLRIANNGQKIYRDYMLSKQKKKEFSQHIIANLME